MTHAQGRHPVGEVIKYSVLFTDNIDINEIVLNEHLNTNASCLATRLLYFIIVRSLIDKGA